MIKQIPSKEIKKYVKNNPKCVLFDVRTEKEWNIDGKPDGQKIGLKTYFLTRNAKQSLCAGVWCPSYRTSMHCENHVFS